MRFAILGTGNVGKTLAAGLHAKGHDVVMGELDRTPEGLDAWLAEHPGIDLATFADAAKRSETVVLAVAWPGVPAVLEATGPHLSGKLLIDVTNPIVFEGGSPRFDGCEPAGVLVQQWAPHARVVKCWNIVGYAHMVDPDLSETPTMFIAGDDRAAKEDVRTLLGECGWHDVVDLGGIDASRDLEGMAMVLIRTCIVTGSDMCAFRLTTGPAES